MDNLNKFTKFYLNTQSFAGWIMNEEDLINALDELHSKEVSLFRITAKNSLDRFEFGNKFEHTGRTSLLEFLDANGIDISRWLSAKKHA